MSLVFADTYFYLALIDQSERAHTRATSLLTSVQAIVTTEFVILELGNACSRATDHGDFLALLESIRLSRKTRVVPLGSQLLQSGVGLMRQRPDKDWSLTDCISFKVMEELGIREALTADRHFEQAGFTALLV